MAALSSSAITLAIQASVVASPRRCGNNPATTTSVLRRRGLTGLAMNSPGMNDNAGFLIKRATRISAADPGSPVPGPLGGNLPPIPGLPQWAQWLVGAIVFAVPLYRQFRTMEDRVEQTAEVAIEIIEKVAEETEKIADEVADAFPANKKLKEVASKIKAVAEVIDEDAHKAEALIEKADELEKEMDAIVDKIAKK